MPVPCSGTCFQGMPELTAERFVEQLGSDMPVGEIFKLARQYAGLPPAEIEQLLSNPGSQSPRRRGEHHGLASPQQEDDRGPPKGLLTCTLERHNYVDSWDLVDRSAPYVTQSRSTPSTGIWSAALVARSRPPHGLRTLDRRPRAVHLNRHRDAERARSCDAPVELSHNRQPVERSHASARASLRFAS